MKMGHSISLIELNRTQRVLVLASLTCFTLSHKKSTILNEQYEYNKLLTELYISSAIVG
jgi:hypothetical protein